MSHTPTFSARFSAAAVALAGFAALATQAVVSHALTGGIGATIWVLAGYFTVLTNLLVALTFAALTPHPARFSASWHAGLTLWIVIVGVVYHLILARLWAPKGVAWWADQGLHTAVPGLALLWWIACAPKSQLGPRDAVVWLIWPLAYLFCALVRGMFTAKYPYPFIDVAALGYGAVAVNTVGMLLAFYFGGLAMVGVAKALTR